MSLTIGLLAEARYLSQLQPSGLADALTARGHDVRIIDPRRTTWDSSDCPWLDDLDIVIARGRSWELFNLLSAAEARGVPTLNNRSAIAAVHNKAEMSVRLAASGVPIPRTFIGTSEQLAASIPRDHYPLIVKPVFGDNARGLHIFCSANELGTVQAFDVMIAQHFLDSDGFDVKLYAIGADVTVVRKPSPLATTRADAVLLPVTREAREIARRCGDMFGLQLFGVDCIDTPQGLKVIEVNDYPNYTSVPQADERLARFVESLQSDRRVKAS
ncbi:MAG TPA: ATP-grasp domain-containing protein [Thermoanaerobaculia bacterium]